MPKIKKARVPIKIDMTPMVDVATLLVLFFMLTTQFRPPEDVQIVLPASHSQFKLPESDVMTITIDKAGQIYMGVDAQQLRRSLFESMYPNGVPGKDGRLIPVWLASSVPIQEKDLVQLVVNARIQNIRLRTVIKADRDADYGPVMDVMNDLQKANVTRFNLQTDLARDNGSKGGS
ncbi:MAG: ExbD/TolR family protein [Candidatus Kryptoniota bacterium]